MVNWKVALWSGAAGFALSFLVGVVGGVMFGRMILQALLWGVLFALLGAGIYYVVLRFLPELAAGRSPRAKSEGGGNIDIVLPDENPHLRTEDSNELAEEIAEPGHDEGADGEDEASMVEEVEEHPPQTAGEARSGDEPFFAEVADGELGVAEELPELEGDGDIFKGRSSSSPKSSSRVRGRNAADILGGQTDPEEVARAIRTVLKKDQKG